MIKTIFVKANFKPITKDFLEDQNTGEYKSNWLGQKKEIISKTVVHKQVGWSDCEIDGEQLSKDVNKVLEEVKEDNFTVVAITTISSGRYNYEFSSQGITSSKRTFSETEKVSGGGSYGYGYGFSYTEGILIVLEKK